MGRVRNGAPGPFCLRASIMTTRTDRPGYPALVLAMLLLVYIFNFLDRQILGILTIPIQKSLNLNDADMGFIGGTAFALTP